MRLLIVSEGESELGGALPELVQRLVGKEVEWEVRTIRDPEFRVHGGKGPGFLKRAIRCMIYALEHGFEGLVLVVDEDGDVERRRQFDRAQEHQMTNLPRALGIAIRT